MIICWLKGKHNWTNWLKLLYSDGRTAYWSRYCTRCRRWEIARKEPKW